MLIKLATCDRRGLRPAEVAELVQGGRQAVDPPRLRADREVLDPARRSPLMAHAGTRSAGQEPAGHARACGGEVRADREPFRREVKVVKDDQEANGKSIMGLLTLVAAHGVTMTVVCDGDDAAAAVAALAELVGTGFGEGVDP